MGHYASAHNDPNFQGGLQPGTPPAIAASSAVPTPQILQRPKSSNQPTSQQAIQQDDVYYPHPVACILPAGKSARIPAMAAQRPHSRASKPTQAPGAGVQKSRKKASKGKKVAFANQGSDKENESLDEDEDEEMDTSEEDDIPLIQRRGNAIQQGYETEQPRNTSQKETVTEEVTVPQSSQHPPKTRLNKAGKVQELVPVKAPKQPDPIRGLAEQSRFAVEDILRLPITVNVGQLLDKSDLARQELALAMQRSTPKYRVKKATKAKGSGQHAVQQTATDASSVIAASVHTLPPVVTAYAHDDDGQSQPLMVASRIGFVKSPRTLLDGGAIVELVNRQFLLTLNPPPRVHTDWHLKISLATDAIHTLTNYCYLPVNIEGVEAIVKAWVVDNQVYDLLLGVPWMRRVGYNLNYRTGEVTVTGNDEIARKVPVELFPITPGLHLPTVEIDDEVDDEDAADAACQLVIDEQENYYP
ncbi:MAG: hypothetical protein Q9188_005641 [Gyalolechia gomerana]